MQIVSAVHGGSLMALCLPTPGTAQYMIFVAANFVAIFI